MSRVTPVLWISWICAVSLIAGASGSTAKMLEIDYDSDPQRIPTIRVDGPDTGGYDRVVTDKVKVRYLIRGEPPGSPFRWTIRDYHVRVKGSDEPGSTGGLLTPQWAARDYEFSYVEPRFGTSASGTGHATYDPVALCNQELARRTGSARQHMLRSGTALVRPTYILTANTWWFTDAGRADHKHASADVEVTVRVECLALDRTRARETSTTGRRGQELARDRARQVPAPVGAVVLRGVPTGFETVGSLECPTVVNLYGHVEALREFSGRSVIMAPGYASNVETLAFAGPGWRTVLATYPVKWEKEGIGGLAAAPAGQARSQSVEFTLNVSRGPAGSVIESAKESALIRCRRGDGPRQPPPDRRRP